MIIGVVDDDDVGSTYELLQLTRIGQDKSL